MPFDVGPSMGMQSRFGMPRMGVGSPEMPRPMNPGAPMMPPPMGNPGMGMATGNIVAPPPPRLMPPGMGGSGQMGEPSGNMPRMGMGYRPNGPMGVPGPGAWHPQNNSGFAGGRGFPGGGPGGPIAPIPSGGMNGGMGGGLFDRYNQLQGIMPGRMQGY